MCVCVCVCVCMHMRNRERDKNFENRERAIKDGAPLVLCLLLMHTPIDTHTPPVAKIRCVGVPLKL